MKCPYCGNDDPAAFLYPEDDNGPYVICLVCNGEFEQEEIEYYDGQSEDEGKMQNEQVSLSTIIQVIDNEIQWSKDHREQVPDNEADWFVKGLEQAKYLILETFKVCDDLSEGNTESFPAETEISLDNLPRNLRFLRKWQRLTLKEVAKKCGLSHSYISDIERGRTIPTLETLQKLALAYKIPLTIHLFADNDPMGAPGWMGDYSNSPHGPFDA